MMKSLSLIHAIVLLHEGERLNGRKGDGRLVRNAENIARAKELACQVLGRNLRKIPSQAQVLFLLIEQLGEQVCKAKRIDFSTYRFTKKEIRAQIGWSDRVIGSHLKILESTGYVGRRETKYQILQSSQIVSRIVFSINKQLQESGICLGKIQKSS